MKQTNSDLKNEVRQHCFYSQRELRQLLRAWNATSDDVKRAIIHDAAIALDSVPLPDDMQDDGISSAVGASDSPAKEAAGMYDKKYASADNVRQNVHSDGGKESGK